MVVTDLTDKLHLGNESTYLHTVCTQILDCILENQWSTSTTIALYKRAE